MSRVTWIIIEMWTLYNHCWTNCRCRRRIFSLYWKNIKNPCIKKGCSLSCCINFECLVCSRIYESLFLLLFRMSFHKLCTDLWRQLWKFQLYYSDSFDQALHAFTIPQLHFERSLWLFCRQGFNVANEVNLIRFHLNCGTAKHLYKK